MSLSRPTPCSFLAERACRDDDVDREVHEAALVDDKEVQLEQPGKQSAAFLVFRLFPGAAFFQVSRKGQSLHVRGLTYSILPWCHGCQAQPPRHKALIGAKFDSPECWPARGCRSESLSQDFSTNGHRKNRPRHFTRGRRARSRSVPRGGEEHERPRKLSRQTPRFGSSPIPHRMQF